MTTRVRNFVLEERCLQLTRPFFGHYSTTIPTVQAAWYSIRSQKVRCRFLSPYVTSIGYGRPGGSIERKGGHAERALKKKSASQGHLVQVTPSLSFVGVHFFAAWMQQHGSLRGVIPLLQQAIQAYRTQHPEEDFPLFHHKEETLLLRVQARFSAPLLGIGKLTAFDVTEHPRLTLQGRSSHSATLSQFLGHLERIDAAEALMPALLPATAGQMTSVDGPRIAYWARVAMHKGNITMLGRIMAGSQAVIAHNEVGHARCVTYSPPDMHVSQVIVD